MDSPVTRSTYTMRLCQLIPFVAVTRVIVCIATASFSLGYTLIIINKQKYVNIIMRKQWRIH